MTETTSYRPEQIRREDGKWVNSKVFREEGLKFMRNGYYCSDPYGSPGYLEYWTEHLRRCEEGYSVGGHKITGHHYQYLNYSQIEIVSGEEEDGDVTAKKETKCPDFWDGDYDYFWSIEIAKNGLFTKKALATSQLEKEIYKKLPEVDQRKEKQKVLDRLNLRVKPHPDYLDGGNHVIVGKSRRKGYSYKNAAICANVYNTTRKALTLIGAFDKKFLYPEGTMGMASNYLNFFNKHTAWTKGREYVDKQEHKKASFVETIDGIKVESGYKSQIMAITFADNPDAARGKDAMFVLFEEAGKFPNLKASYLATQPGLTAGKYITGQMLIFGTGGDMEVGTVDFADMFYNPVQFGLMPFENIWDTDEDGEPNALGTYCGFFHPVYLNMEGFYDEMGNSDIDAAIRFEKEVRKKLKKNSTSATVLQQRVQEWPMNPAEAFLTVSSNDFPTMELRAQLNKVKREHLNTRFGMPCYFDTQITKEVDLQGNIKEVRKWCLKPDLVGIKEPIWNYKLKDMKDLTGSVIVYEHPIANAPKGLYKIGFDPYRHETSSSSQPSLASIYVYKGCHKNNYTRETIVAQYHGRPYDPDDVNAIAMKFAEAYNTEVMFENEVTHVKKYFEKKRKLHLLAGRPEGVINANINNSQSARVYGIHMVEKLKDAGEKYIKQWLLEVRDFDENGDSIYNLETIYDIGLLEELILYNRKGNFDRVMAFMMVMFQRQEEDEGKEYDTTEKQRTNADDLLEMMKNQFKKNTY